jgi:SAM-dependent methyltransferase
MSGVYKPLFACKTGDGVTISIFEKDGRLTHEVTGSAENRQSYEKAMAEALPRWGHILKKRAGKRLPVLPGTRAERQAAALEDGRRYVSMIEIRLMNYAYSWDQVSKKNASEGVYDNIAKFAGIKDDELWLDIGCGSSRLAEAVFKKAKPVYFGVEFNEYLLDASREVLESAGQKPSVNSSYEIAPDKDCGWEIHFLPDPSFRIGQANLILDDNRFLDDFTALLLPRQPDKATFAIPGGLYGPLFYEFAVMPLYIQNEHYALEHMRGFAVQRVVDVLRPGGELVLVLPGTEQIDADGSHPELEQIEYEKFPYVRHDFNAGMHYRAVGKSESQPENPVLHAWRFRKRS